MALEKVMMRRIKVFLVLVAVCLAGSCFAQNAEPQLSPEAKDIARLMYIVYFDEGDMSGPLGPVSMTQALERQKKGQEDLEKYIGPAIQAAGDHPDLRQAIKAFYMSAQAFFQNAVPDVYASRVASQTSISQLKADLDAKAAGVKLEAKLAGMDLHMK